MSGHQRYAIEAVYYQGALNLLVPLDLPEGARVRVDVHLDTVELPVTAEQAHIPATQVAALYRWVNAPRLVAPAVALAALGRESIYD